MKKNKNSTTILIIALVLICTAVSVILVTGATRNGNMSATGDGNLTGKHYIMIEIQGRGSIVLELDADTAPITVTNFMKLVRSGFYDGLTFHRIISGFMIQGGDPNGNGTGGSSEKIRGEFLANGVQNNISHVRGTISMARSGQPDSASSQFFIMHADATYLDGQYAGFGKVLSGMEVVDAICAETPVTDNNGSVAKHNQPVITTIKELTAEETASYLAAEKKE